MAAEGFTANSTQMRNIADQVEVQRANYQAKINDIVDQINQLGQLWNSPAFDQFKLMFDQKLPSLNSGNDLMAEFRDNLNNAADSYDEAQRRIIQNVG